MSARSRLARAGRATDTCAPSHTVILLLFVTGAGLVLSAFYLMLTRAFTKIIMHITLVLSILLNM